MLEWLTRKRPFPERLVTIGLTLMAIGVVDEVLIRLIDPSADSGIRAFAVPALLGGATTMAIGLLLGRSDTPNGEE